MLIKALLLFFVSLITWKSVNSADCSVGTTSTSCGAISGCIWESGVCDCASNVAMDIVFALDASGSIGYSAFQNELTWLEGVITNGLGSNTRLDFIRFATDVDELLTFPAEAAYTQQQLLTFVADIVYTGGDTDTVGAIQAAINQFALYSTANRSKILIIITDGNPNAPNGDNDVCAYASTLVNDGIETILMGVGADWTPAIMDCLCTSSADVIPVSGFTTSGFNSVLPQVTAITCPVSYDLIITEVHVSPTNTINGSRFIEIYNPSTQVTLSDLELSGLFTGTLTNNNGIVLNQGQYLVIYDVVPTYVPQYPDCSDCSCTFNNSFVNKHWCQNAIYIACNNSCVTNKYMNVTNFYQRLIDSSSGSIINSVQWNSSWPIATVGYSYELKNKAYDGGQGSNWLVSCDNLGTPGADPLSNCSSCFASQCQLNNDTAASCINNKCSCTNGFYTTIGSSCYIVPPPGPCTAYWITNGSVNYVEFIWSKPSTTLTVNYSLGYYTNQNSYDTVTTSSRLKDLFDYQYSRGAGAIAGYVSTLIGSAQSVGVACYPTTQAPTNVPTKTPTVFPTPAPTSKPTPKPTKTPTSMPTFPPTSKPTFGPTYDNPDIYISGDICEEDRCSCNGYSWDCTGEPIYKEFAKSSDEQFITIRKYPIDYPFLINVYWEIVPLGSFDNTSLLNNTGRRRTIIINKNRKLLQTSISTTSIMSNMSSMNDSNSSVNYYTSITPSAGVLYFNDSFEEKIAVIINSIGLAVAGFEYYILNLLNCSCENQQICTLTYPSQLYIVVQDSAADTFTNNTSETQEPWWLWWVIGALIVFLFILAWLVYRYWWKHRQTHEQLQETEKELDDQIAENELGFGNDLQQGDVGFNPLATGVPNTTKAPDTYGSEMDARKNAAMNNNADVHVEKFQHREEFGQAKPGRGNNNLKEPLLGNGF